MLYKRCEKYCNDCGITDLMTKKGAVIVALSGGADSSVLLSFFVSVREKFPEMQIIAAHVNHMIRGEEADRDEEFCRRICDCYGIPLKVRKADIPALAKETGESIYWLTLLKRTNLITYDFDKMLSLAEEIKRMLIASLNTAKENKQ